MLPRVLPPDWSDCGVIDLGGFPARRYEQGGRHPLRVLVSIDDRGEAGRWLHSSLSYASRLPGWADVRRVHEVIHGDRIVIQVLPPREHWLNVMPFCLHLFERLDANTVPDGLWRHP